MNNEWGNKRDILDYETELGRHSRGGLNRSDKMRNKQYKNNRTLKMIKEVRTGIPIKRNKTLDKKKRNELRYNLKRIRIKIITSNIYKTREIIIHKRLPRRLTL